MDSEPLIFELGSPGRDGVRPPIPQFDGSDLVDLLPAEELREGLPLPEVSEVDVMRHFLRLSHRNHSVDTAMYPLGSCTMKYNPKL
ncbi:MAG TPA: aminomethyl-transferring glycine dehydrogenase subunit GcvPB, partial [Chloroflexi bacterium]|nr:aminomethyl-transferring glycine dehydrogenase subunit GcvPB [Chloroflexota bacterium]